MNLLVNHKHQTEHRLLVDILEIFDDNKLPIRMLQSNPLDSTITVVFHQTMANDLNSILNTEKKTNKKKRNNSHSQGFRGFGHFFFINNKKGHIFTR